VVATDGEPSVTVDNAGLSAGSANDGVAVPNWRELVTKSMSTFRRVGA
jgi:hypothetical protein